MTNEMLKFTMRDKHNIQFTKEEAKVAIDWYKQMILILESVQNDPSIIPSMIQSLYSAISEVQKNAKTTEEKESAEEANKETDS